MDTLILLQARTVRAVREISLSFSFFLVSKLIIASRRRISSRSRCRVFNNGTFIRCIVVYVSGSLRRPSIYSEGNLLREWIDPWKCVHFATRWWTWPNGSRVFLAFPYPSVLENIHRVPRKLNFVDSFCTRNDKKHWPMRVRYYCLATRFDRIFTIVIIASRIRRIYFLRRISLWFRDSNNS